MCGFWVSIGLPRLPAAIDPIRRRGPDQCGSLDRRTAAGTLRLVHRRLAISDLSERSSQPFTVEGEAGSLVWNGALYDFRERRAHLQSQGRRLRSEGDTEVLAHLLAERGLDALADLDAMFALAWYSRRNNTLILARDRFGEKPLLWASGRGPEGSWFAAGSDLRQFLAIPRFERRINASQAADFLNFGAADAPDETFLQGVHRVRAGCAIELDLSSPEALRRSVTVGDRPWPGAKLSPIQGLGSENAASEAVLSALSESIRLRIASSDVPYGACVSGGLDSTLVVALIKRLGGHPVGVSALVDDPSMSERPWVNAVQDELALECVEVMANASLAASALEPTLVAQGEPVPNTSAILQWMVFQAAKERGLKVMLDGQGADELFGGYPSMLGVWLADQLKSEGPLAWARAVRALTADDSGLRAPDLHRATFRALVPERARRVALGLAGKWPPAGLIAHGSPPPARRPVSFQALCDRLIEQDSLPTLLRYEDRNAMDHGVETRLPYLAPQVASLAAGIPSAFKVRGGWRKAPLRDAAAGLIPRFVRDRRRKLGFTTPHEAWMAGPVGDICRAYVSDLSRSPAASLFIWPHECPRDPDRLFRTASYLRWAHHIGASL